MLLAISSRSTSIATPYPRRGDSDRAGGPRSGDPVRLEEVRPQLLVRQAGGDPDQLAGVGDAVLGGDRRAVLEQPADVLVGRPEHRGDAEEEAEPAHRLEARGDRPPRDVRPG